VNCHECYAQAHFRSLRQLLFPPAEFSVTLHFADISAGEVPAFPSVLINDPIDAMRGSRVSGSEAAQAHFGEFYCPSGNSGNRAFHDGFQFLWIHPRPCIYYQCRRPGARSNVALRDWSLAGARDIREHLSARVR
jgi:hypothetical protein